MMNPVSTICSHSNKESATHELKKEKIRVYVCVCVCEREREREREWSGGCKEMVRVKNAVNPWWLRGQLCRVHVHTVAEMYITVGKEVLIPI